MKGGIKYEKDTIFQIIIASVAVLLTVIAIYPFLKKWHDSMIPEEKSGPCGEVIYGIGAHARSDMGVIVFTEHDENSKTLKFAFDKFSDQSYGFCFTGVDNINNVFYNIYSPYEYDLLQPYPEKAIITYEGLKFTVNGEKRNELPFEKGYYEITVDYSGIYDYCDNVSEVFLIIGFGVFTF